MWSTSGRELCKAASRSVVAGKDVATNRGVAATRGVEAIRGMAAIRGVQNSRSLVRRCTGNVNWFHPSCSVSTHESIFQTQTQALPRSATEDKKLLFPADDRIKEMLESVRRGFGQGVRIAFNSAQPIRPEQVELAFKCLIRKADAFRACFHERGDELWVAEMVEPVLDFKVVEGTCLDEQMKVLMTPPRHMHDQPMFSVRMMVPPQDIPIGDVPHGSNDGSKVFPHLCHLLLTFNHAMHDGVIQYMTIEWIFNILDDIVSGRPIDDSELGTLRPGVEARESEDRVRRELLKDPDSLSKLLKERAERNTTPLLIEAFGSPPDEAEATTGILVPEIMSNEMIENFKKKCQSVGATLNSGFLGLHNTALVEVVKEAGLEKEAYDININFPVDTRRYMNPTNDICFGFHGMPIIHTMTTPRDVKRSFWQYVQELDASVRGKIKNKHVYKERVLDMMLRQDTHATESPNHNLPALKHDYSFSNVYFSRATCYGIGRSIRLANFIRYNLIETTDMGMLSSLAASGDQGIFQVTYSSRYVTERNAVKLNESIMRVFHDLAK